MRARLILSVFIGAGTASFSGCQLPVVVCEQKTERWQVRFPRVGLELLPSGGFRVLRGRQGVYANCADFCRHESDVKRVESCTEPVVIDESFVTPRQDADDLQSWRMECTALAMHCDVPRTAQDGPGLVR
jgi:hypothetical protein